MTYPTDSEIDTAFPDNNTGDIGADDMRAFQKAITAAGKDYASITENAPVISVTAHDATKAYLKDDLVSHLGSIYFAIEDHDPAAFDLTNWRSISGTTGSGITIRYEWTDTQAGQVPSGQFGLTGTPADLTNTVRVSVLSQTGLDVGVFWANIRSGDYILFIEDSGGAESWYGVATGPSVLQAGTPDWYEIPCDLIAFVGESENNRSAFVSIITNPAAKLPDGGTTGQVLTKLSDDDYDVGWTTPV